eukprot:12920-Chlamydomonas_euryale.AAC.1
MQQGVGQHSWPCDKAWHSIVGQETRRGAVELASKHARMSTAASRTRSDLAAAAAGRTLSDVAAAAAGRTLSGVAAAAA